MAEPRGEAFCAHAAKRPRWGYRRLQVLLQREGHVVNHKRVFRLYQAEGLAVRRKKRKKPVENAYIESFNGKLRDECPNENWFIDHKDARSGPAGSSGSAGRPSTGRAPRRTRRRSGRGCVSLLLRDRLTGDAP